MKIANPFQVYYFSTLHSRSIGAKLSHRIGRDAAIRFVKNLGLPLEYALELFVTVKNAK